MRVCACISGGGEGELIFLSSRNLTAALTELVSDLFEGTIKDDHFLLNI